MEEPKLEESKPSRVSVRLVVAVVLIVILAGALAWVVAQGPARTAPSAIEYPIGVAIATSGTAYATEGPLRRDAALLAIEHFNAQLDAAGSPVTFRPIHEDTKGTGADALAAMEVLAAAGVQVVVGPLSTGEVAGVKTFADTNKIVTISPSSTGVNMAVPGDYVFRAAATDIPQAKALAQLVADQGYTKVAVMARNDDYGKGIATLFASEFTTKHGGQVEQVLYQVTTGITDWQADVSILRTKVDALGVGTQTAVLVAAFDADGLNIFGHASNDPVLGTVRWFGSESTRRPGSFLPPGASSATADFLVETRFTGFFATAERNRVSVAFETAYQARWGKPPSPYSYYTYDASWMAMLSVLMAGSYDGEAIRGVLPAVAERYTGASGYKGMDANGDLAQTDYTVWQVMFESDAYKYKDIGKWFFATEELQYFP